MIAGWVGCGELGGALTVVGGKWVGGSAAGGNIVGGVFTGVGGGGGGGGVGGAFTGFFGNLAGGGDVGGGPEPPAVVPCPPPFPPPGVVREPPFPPDVGGPSGGPTVVVGPLDGGGVSGSGDNGVSGPG